MYKRQRRINNSEFESTFAESGYDVEIVEGVAHLPQWQLYRLMTDWQDQKSTVHFVLFMLIAVVIIWLFIGVW